VFEGLIVVQDFVHQASNLVMHVVHIVAAFVVLTAIAEFVQNLQVDLFLVNYYLYPLHHFDFMLVLVMLVVLNVLVLLLHETYSSFEYHYFQITDFMAYY
jgi:hypothetical protein